MVDLATSRYGGMVLWCNDEFFADAANLVSPHAPIYKEGVFTDHGKWMDGWETRRRREEGYDSCVIRLGLPGIIHTVTVDTSYFTGNYPESFSLDACGVESEELDGAEWVEIIPRSALSGDTQATYEVADPHRVTHLRLNIYPDGGVARLRVDGDPIPSMSQVCPSEALTDLAVATVGGQAIDVSDAHYASPANLVSPTEPEGMWDGWETARRRGPGHDWSVIRLGLPGLITGVDVDTRHFKGNAPGWVTIDVATGEEEWVEACGRTAVKPHFVNRIDFPEPVHADRVRLNIHPDGGVARLRVWGRPDPEAAAAVRMRYVDSLFPQPARLFFTTACGSRRWVEAMVAGRPYREAERLLKAAEEAFAGLAPDDWMEAFAAHPRIGERHGRQNQAGESMSTTEQSGVDTADEALARELEQINRRYEDRFGYTYIVRAAGRSGPEMLELAHRRLDNDPDTELEMAATQQREITMLRLRRMLCLNQHFYQ